MSSVGSGRVLYIIACAAPPALDVHRLVKLAQERRWDTCLIVTPEARKFVDEAALEELTGHPVRSKYRRPGEEDPLPPPDAIAVAPATTNTINKWAAGISDTLALGLLVEAIGKGLPVVAMPFTNRAQAAHPAFEPNIESLRSWGVNVLYGSEVYPLQEPGMGMQVRHTFPWKMVVDALDART
jgi:phosphopantothenoylcysteine decarboxylase